MGDPMDKLRVDADGYLGAAPEPNYESEEDDFIEEGIENHPFHFAPASVWYPPPGYEMLQHPEYTEQATEQGLPPMSPVQLAAYYRIKDLLLGRLQFQVPDTVDYWDWQYKLAGRVIILTGCAGSGKSHLVKWLRATLPNATTLCATTGSAALLIGGNTVDMLFGIKRQPWQLLYGITEKNMNECSDGIIIDEASMIGERMAGLLTMALHHYRTKRVLLVGDWAQASPVKDIWPFRSELFRAAEIIRLNECHRQSDPEYLAALNEVRRGAGSPYFERCESPEPSDDEQVIRVFATNKMTDELNRRRYGMLRKQHPDATECRLYCSLQVWGKLRDGTRGWEDCIPTSRKEYQAMEECNLAHNERFCVGARVLITRNSKPLMSEGITREFAYVNGDVGTIVEIRGAGGTPIITVELDRNQRKVTIEQAQAEVMDTSTSSRRPTYLVTGFPLKLGYAVTIHKTQGMTLPALWGDMKSIAKHRRGNDKSGMHGLAYVLMSRTRRIEDLRLRGTSSNVAYCDPMTYGIV